MGGLAISKKDDISSDEVVEAIHARCVEMDLADIMSFQCDWNEEVVAQFYATLWVDTINHVMH